MASQLRLEKGSMLRIHRTSGRAATFTISGQLDADSVNGLCELVDAEPADSVLVLDLTDLVLADRDAVRFLREYENRGRVVLRHCPAYVRTWMASENDHC
jgi:ABC-type transporter Mla MlaB component